MLDKIEQRFDAAIDRFFNKAVDQQKEGENGLPLGTSVNDLRKFIHRHERKSECVRRLFGQLDGVYNEQNIDMNLKKFDKVFDAAAQLFIITTFKHQHESYMTDIEKRQKQEEHERQQMIEKVAEEEGFFVEDGTKWEKEYPEMNLVASSKSTK